ncbi:Hypothetical_protein [Hexamita inflata]|uniref:Hypothetical_protein n=1 Tax=Hexamita inflata TaxID=28002 RepID=A0AA86U6P9_9EUKA|nr:Hypothetical protein HINF_LOCUS29011 [Hexamita inflata]
MDSCLQKQYILQQNNMTTSIHGVILMVRDIGGANNLQTSLFLAVLILQLGQIRNALGSWIYLPLFQSYSSFFIVIPTCRFQFFSYGFQIQNLRQSQHLSYINMVSLVEVSSMVLLDVNFNLRQFKLWNKQIHSKNGQ